MTGCDATPEAPRPSSRPVASVRPYDPGALCGGGSVERPEAVITAIEPYSPADDAGFTPGYRILDVDGHPVRDLIDWQWLTADDVITLGYVDPQGEPGTVSLEREVGERWGFTFDGVVFDSMKLCRNACSFCFIRQMPPSVRPSLTMRDDDYRLSFLSGTFVTLTNLAPEDEQRIIDQSLSPLRVSLHAVDGSVRRRLIGTHAQEGLDALQRLLDAGIQVDSQIVLIPGENDGRVLEETLEWAYQRPGIRNVGIVPLGFTRFQTQFSESFNAPEASSGVLETIRPFQERAMAERGTPWVCAADEFYINAYGRDLLEHLPSSSFYGEYEMFEDGIGMVRSYVDDFREAQREGLFDDLMRTLEDDEVPFASVSLVVGEAMQPLLDMLLASTSCAGRLTALTVANRYFGGNVSVTGLLTGQDIVAAIGAQTHPGRLFAIPSVVFNTSGLTLDDMSLDDIQQKTGGSVAVVSCNPSEYLRDINRILVMGGDRPE